MEPSVQGNIGSMFISDESGENRFDVVEVDWADWCQAELNMAASSKSAKQYAKKFEKYILSFIAP